MRRLILLAPLIIAACGDTARLPITAGQGSNPVLPAPVKSILPTINIAKSVGWPAGIMPTPAQGLAVNAFASGLQHPRWLYRLPDGDLLVAETNGPKRPDDEKGFMGKAQALIMGLAGATVASPDRITLLRDTNGDGVADLKTPFLTGLYSPFGMVLVGDQLFVAEADKLRRFTYVPGATAITTPGTLVAPLPGGPRNHHWTKNVVASADGKTLFVAVGSNSNAGENGLEIEKNRADILAIDPATGATKVFATGLRNPVGMAWNPVTSELWASVNERDEIGSDLVPDYMTSVKPGAHYGWPWSWYGQHVDARVQPARPDMVAKAIAPDFALGPHTASLGLAFAPGGAALGPQFASGAFVGQHGSWNRKPASGYKVVFVPFADGKPDALPVDVLTGFLNAGGQAQGRPVGVAFDTGGALLVADDVGNTVWRVKAQAAKPALPGR
ncbi:MAG: sorbosone dehydrogenase family protein [Sandarakinorhabdus sp.]|nr:sorbosone dehydrogenase family protein [Sandarakinorhabdus sp.]